MQTFFKYHGTGNDFILMDNRDGSFIQTEVENISKLCNRHFGIGADGLILLTKAEGYDFGMDYFNSDGRRSSMCGNGGRCITAFAQKMGIIRDHAHFLAVDGPHESMVSPLGINLRMSLPIHFSQFSKTDYFIDTGSPHYVQFIKMDIHHFPVVEEGKKIRNRDEYIADGCNVNFVNENADGSLFVRTYERGVEDETLSCGTGVTAVAEIYSRINQNVKQPVIVITPGGTLHVHVKQGEAPWLEGPATFVFEGRLSL